MSRYHRNNFKRHYVRLKGWLTLGSVGITPRLVIAFAAVAALAAAANLIVENWVSILEQQHNAELERSTHDSQAISTLRESVGRAEKLVTSAKLSVAVGVFDRAVHEHVQIDTRASATRYSSARASLGQVLNQFVRDTPASNQSLTRVVNAHRRTADALVQATRKRREPLRKYSEAVTSIDSRVRESSESALKIFGHVLARQPLLDLHARLTELRAAIAMSGAFGGDASVASLENAERAVAETLLTNQSSLRRSQGSDWYQGIQNDVVSLVPLRTAFVRIESQRIAALDSFARESRKLAALLPADLEVEPQPLEASVPQVLAAPAPFAKPDGSLVAWISAAVLLVLLYVCFATIFTDCATGSTHDRRHQPAGTRRRYTRSRDWRHSRARLNWQWHSIQWPNNSLQARAATRDAQQRLEAKVEERTRQLQELAEQDPLTGVANRRQLFVALNAALERARLAGERVGVFFLDIDNFKTLNDSMGHPYGDRVLIAIARRLESIASCCGFAARLGGDEFTIVHQGATGTAEILAFGESIIRAFESPAPGRRSRSHRERECGSQPVS
jgi:GGDEF domain-containing protein